jgi:HEAT repeat protein
MFGLKRTIRQLASEDRQTRDSAVKKLGESKRADAVGPLAYTVATTPDRDLQDAVVDALAEIGTQAVEPLCRLLDVPNAQVQFVAARALVRLDDSRGVDALIELLKQSEQAVTLVEGRHFVVRRRDIANELVAAADRRAVDPLADALIEATLSRPSEAHGGGLISGPNELYERWQEDTGASSLWSALNEIEPHLKTSETGRRMVSSLLAASSDADANWDGARELMVSVDPEWAGSSEARAAVPSLIDLLNRRSEASIRAAHALGEIGDERAIEPLVAALADAGLASTAADALGEIGNERAVEPLVAALVDTNIAVPAAAALRNLGSKAAIDPLVRIVLSWDASSARPGVVQELNEVDSGWVDDHKSAELAQALTATLGYEGTADALRRLGPVAADALLLFVAQSGPWTAETAEYRYTTESPRWTALALLAELEDPRAVEPLLDALGAYASAGWAADDSWMWEALLKSEGPALAALRSILTSGERGSGYAARLLGKIGDPQAVGPLISATARPEVAAAAVAAIEDLLSTDSRREQGFFAMPLRGLPGAGGSFRRPPAGWTRDPIVA